MHNHFILALTLWLSASHALTYAEGGFIARVGASGEFLEMEDQHTGQIVKDYLPVNRAGEVRYFSAGVGVEERRAEYPPFALKLVFTAGGKPYLTGVDRFTLRWEERISLFPESRSRPPGCLSIFDRERMTCRQCMAIRNRR